MRRLDFRALGDIAVLSDGVPSRLRPMEQELLAILLADHNRVVTADRLIESLWRGDPPRSSRTALRVHVDRLRRAISAGGVSRLVFVTHGYRLVVEPGEFDVERFEVAIRRGRDMAAEPATASQFFRSALTEWRGTPFSQIKDIAAVDDARAALERRRTELLVALADAELAAGRHVDVLPELIAWCRAEPYSEPLARALATGLFRAGDAVGAAEACRRFAETLRSEVAVDPSDEFVRLHRQILAGALPAGPEPVTRAVAPTLPGREPEVLAVLDEMRDSGPGELVAVVGPRGSGTSAVLREVHRLVPDAVLVRCDRTRPLAVTEGIEQALLGSDGGRDRSVTADMRAQSLCRLLDDRGVPAVLIDDVHRLGADDADVLHRIVMHRPAATAVVTAGRGMGAVDNPLLADDAVLAAARPVSVPPLTSVASDAVVASLLRADQSDQSDVVAGITALSDGDAYVLTALARHVRAGGTLDEDPPSITEFARRAVAELSPADAEVLACAALMEEGPVDLAAVAAACDRALPAVTAAVEDGLAAGVVEDSSDGVRLRRRWYRDALVKGLGRARAGELHQRIAEYLASAATPDPIAVARHYRSAAPVGDVATAARWTAVEARHLLDAGAPAAARSRAREAARLARAGGAGSQVELDAVLLEAEACAVLGDVGESQLLAREAARDARGSGWVREFARAAVLSAGPMLPGAAEREGAAALTDEALDATPADGSPARVALLEAWVRARVLGGGAAESRTRMVAAELDSAAESARADVTACLAHRGRYNLSWRVGAAPRDRLACSAALTASAARAREPMLHLEGLRMQVCDQLELGNAVGTSAALESYRAEAMGWGAPLHMWWSKILSATCAAIVGNDAAERNWLAEAEAYAGSVDAEIRMVSVLEREFSAALRTGDFATFGIALTGASAAEFVDEPLMNLASAVVRTRLGDTPDSDDVHRSWRALADGPYGFAAAALVLLALPANNDVPSLLEIVAALERAAGGLCFANGAGCLGPVDVYRADALFRLGRQDVARNALDSARRLTQSWATGWSEWAAKWEGMS